MKYLKINLEDNKSVLVDESADKSNQGFYLMIDETSILYLTVDEHKGTHERNNQWAKITATINHSISLDVPMVIIEDEIEKMAKEKYQYTSQNPPYTVIEPKSKIEGFIAGYKAAQQKGVYSEEDLAKCITFGWELSHYHRDKEPHVLLKMQTNYIQSLKQEYIELETECTYGDECPSKGAFDKQNLCNIIIKTNRDENGQLMAYKKLTA